ncbi:hypothetical protein [Hydrogenophaga sp.]|uniref:hypothetical protein n=1 Tax=Hydrogenophaga sp. TaxID=1904254 RepID=UPI00271EDE2C|nr:hypothetical protein [Hydrogenophaga sp.]MDO9438310.1 hypothetical protein [Hydrogenophaga sp.]
MFSTSGLGAQKPTRLQGDQAQIRIGAHRVTQEPSKPPRRTFGQLIGHLASRVIQVFESKPARAAQAHRRLMRQEDAKLPDIPAPSYGRGAPYHRVSYATPNPPQRSPATGDVAPQSVAPSRGDGFVLTGTVLPAPDQRGRIAGTVLTGVVRPAPDQGRRVADTVLTGDVRPAPDQGRRMADTVLTGVVRPAPDQMTQLELNNQRSVDDVAHSLNGCLRRLGIGSNEDMLQKTELLSYAIPLLESCLPRLSQMSPERMKVISASVSVLNSLGTLPSGEEWDTLRTFMKAVNEAGGPKLT